MIANIIEETLKAVKVLKGWKGLDVLPNVEEKVEDIWMLIKYSDHGDDFLIVGTRDGKRYAYGLYKNLRYSERYGYLRKPELLKSLDSEAVVSNKIYFEFEHAFKKSHMSFNYDKKYGDKATAQWVFDREIDWISNLAENVDTVFDWNHKKDEILHWLVLNEIDTEENKQKLKDANFDNKIGQYKVIGIAGKTDISYADGVTVDDVDFIVVNKKKIDPKKVLRFDHSDEWGEDSWSLSFKGFRPSKN